MRAVSIPLLVLLSSVHCSDPGDVREQWRVEIDTDAPVPDFGSLLLVELLSASGELLRDDTQRLFDVSSAERWPVSFGILPLPAAPRMRARLYRTDQAGAAAAPLGASYIDVTASLPALSGEAATVRLLLPMSCYAVAPDVVGAQSCAKGQAALGPEPTLTAHEPSQSSRVNSWPPAATTACARQAPDDMVCIPGGAFILGHLTPATDLLDADAVPPRLVTLRPFALDRYEYTVGQLRALVQAGEVPAPSPHSAGPYRFCTFLDAQDTTNDDFPANCLPWSTAERACELQGKRLPSEAEWEFVAGNLAQKTTYPWGLDPEICAHALVASGELDGNDECLRGSRRAAGPLRRGHSFVERDVTPLGLYAMAGGVAEWTADHYATYDSDCWQTGAPVLDNPVCIDSAAEPSRERTTRGGSFANVAATARAGARNSLDPEPGIPGVGFRCALSLD
jgi:formylglycine-generating enzyme